MKQILFILIIFALFITGCGNTTKYSQSVKSGNPTPEDWFC